MLRLLQKFSHNVEVSLMPTKKNVLSRILRNIPLFDSMSDDELSLFAQVIRTRGFSKDDVILFEEDTPDYMYLVVSGKVKVIQLSAKGREHVLFAYKKGDFFGEMSLLDGKSSPASVIAMENSEIGLIRREDFERHFLTNEKALNQIIAMLCLKLREAWSTLKVMSSADAEQRLRFFLVNLSKIYGIQDNRGVIISFHLTHKDIAGYAALSRETVTRILRKLVRAGELEILENKNILLKKNFSDKLFFL